MGIPRSSQPNHNIPYTAKSVYKTVGAKSEDTSTLLANSSAIFTPLIYRSSNERTRRVALATILEFLRVYYFTTLKA